MDLSLQDLLSKFDLLLFADNSLDNRLAKSVYLHGLAAQVWEHLQQDILLSKVHGKPDPSLQLWAQSRHQRLYVKKRPLSQR